MNSSAFAPSPSKFFKCSAAASFDSVSVYCTICFKLSSSRGSKCCRRGTAQVSSCWEVVIAESQPTRLQLHSSLSRQTKGMNEGVL